MFWILNSFRMPSIFRIMGVALRIKGIVNDSMESKRQIHSYYGQKGCQPLFFKDGQLMALAVEKVSSAFVGRELALAPKL